MQAFRNTIEFNEQVAEPSTDKTKSHWSLLYCYDTSYQLLYLLTLQTEPRPELPELSGAVLGVSELTHEIRGNILGPAT